MAPHFIQKVNLKEKVDLIEEFQLEFSAGKFEKLDLLLYRIRNDFPDTGAYYNSNPTCIEILSLKIAPNFFSILTNILIILS